MNITSAGNEGVFKDWSLVDFGETAFRATPDESKSKAARPDGGPKVGDATAPDMSGWVEIESDAQHRAGETNRVSGAELDYVDNPGNPSAQCGTAAERLTERLKTEALRRTVVDTSRDQLGEALGIGRELEKEAKANSPLAVLDLRRRAASHAMNDLDSLTGREIALVERYGEKKALSPEDAFRAEKARARLNDAVRAQEKYADALDEYAGKLKEGDPRRADLKALGARVRKRVAVIVGLWTNLKQVAAAAEKAGLPLDKNVALNRRGYAAEIYRQEVRNDDFGFDRLTSFATEYRRLNKTYGEGSRSLTAAATAVAGILRQQVAGVKLPSVIGHVMQLAKNNQLDEATHAAYDAVIKSCGAYRKALAELVDVCCKDVSVSGRRSSGRSGRALHAAWDAADTLVQHLRDLAGHAGQIFKVAGDPKAPENREALERRRDLGNVWDFGKWSKRVDRIYEAFSEDTLESVKAAMTDRDVAALLAGRTSFSSSVESKIWNPDGDYRNDFDGMELMDEKVLGKGVFNTVRLCTFVSAAGEKLEGVFRPELGAVVSREYGAISQFTLDPNSYIGGFVCNDVSQRLARYIGCEDVFPKTTFGTLHGEPGMFLEKASGKTGWTYRVSDRANDPVHCKMSEEAREKAATEVARKLNRLQWMDILSGQIDRHMDNLMIGVAENGDAEVKGIDNDECFPDCDIGGGRYVFRSADEGRQWLSHLGIKGRDACLKPMNEKEKGLNGETAKLFKGAGWFDGVILDIRDLGTPEEMKKILKLYKNHNPPDHIDSVLQNTLKGIDLDDYGWTLSQAGLGKRQVLASKARLLYVRAAMDRPECRQVNPQEWKAIAKSRNLKGNNNYCLTGFARYMGVQ